LSGASSRTGSSPPVPPARTRRETILVRDRHSFDPTTRRDREVSDMERRRFIVKAGGVLAAVGAAAVVDAPNVIAQPKFRWRMPTTWTPALDVLQGSAQRLARVVDETSGGRFQIEVASAGQMMPPLGCFDAASQGTVEGFMASTVHWPTKDPALVWFCTVPFGMNPEGMMAWFAQGDGLKLWEETYAAYNLVPRVGPAVAPQMAGWFRKKINTTGDFKGLKMRIPGLGGKVVAKAGGTVVLIPGGEIYAALERGAIDASEFVGPHDDMKLGLHNTARYYYYPGWHEPGAMTEFTFSKKAYDALPIDLQRTLDHAVAAVQVYGLTDFHAKNAIAFERLKTEFKSRVDVLQLPMPVLRDLKKLAAEVMREEAEKSPMAKKVYASFTKFQALVGPWDHVAEGAYHQSVAM
jgi:TRAP-type mannitol/chloroaromatic compound transport system substrate-binding protein